jgi:fumarylacetoacetase
MSTQLDHTHDPAAQSWVQSANGHAEFPVQNLPMGVREQEPGGIVVAIGDELLDVRAAVQAGLLDALGDTTRAALLAPVLNDWMALPAHERRNTRLAIFDLLKAGSSAEQHAATLLLPRVGTRLATPALIGDYTDFYAGIHHARKAGSLFRPDNPLMPNYRHQPIAYHGRASSITVSGHPVRRPWGLVEKNGNVELQPSARLDFELEMAMWTAGGNALGVPVPIREAAEQIVGFGLFNDWSARDIQSWEYRPLGPFQGKNFASTVSPWVVTAEALAPFRRPAMARDAQDPPLSRHLLDEQDQANGALNIELEVWISTETMRAQGLGEHCIARSHAGHLYWTPAQMLAQHTLGGCNLRAGDLLATGTISTPDHSGDGSLLELTTGGRHAFTLPSGETRTFLHDGDEIILRAHAGQDHAYSIGFGECRARVLPAHQSV